MGYHTVMGLDGKPLEWLYIPSRILLAGIPIKSIDTTSGKVTPGTWEEPLYTNLYVEFGGYNLYDLEFYFASSRFNPTVLKNYLRGISSIHPVFKDIDWESEDFLEQFQQKLFLKHWYDSQVESKYIDIGANRTKQNFCLLGHYDWDDSILKEVPEDNLPEAIVQFSYKCKMLKPFLERTNGYKIFYKSYKELIEFLSTIDLNAIYTSWNHIINTIMLDYRNGMETYKLLIEIVGVDKKLLSDVLARSLLTCSLRSEDYIELVRFTLSLSDLGENKMEIFRSIISRNTLLGDNSFLEIMQTIIDLNDNQNDLGRLRGIVFAHVYNNPRLRRKLLDLFETV